MTKEEAVKLAEAKFWEQLSFRQRAEFQIAEDRLCMPFPVFHEAVEETLGRPVFRHEFAMNRAGLRAEILDGKPAPTFEEVIDLIPAEKRILVVI